MAGADPPSGGGSSHDDNGRRRARNRASSQPRSRNASRHSTNSATVTASARKGLRIFVGSANLGHALPDPESLAAWLPRHGQVRRALNPDVEPSSVFEGISQESWNDVDPRGKFEVVAVGMQEAVAGSNALTATGVTALFTGTSVKERRTFANALGDLGKPLDLAQKKLTEMIGTQTEVGGTSQLKEMVVGHVGEDYALMTEYQRGEMVLYLFVRNDLTSVSSITGLQAQNCGLGSVMANKGGIAALLTVGSTRLSFLSVHLAAGDGYTHYEERNANMGEIVRGTNDPTLHVHHAFVFGDLNYRFSIPPSSRGIESPKDETLSVCQTIVGAKDWATMGKHDELGRALRDGKILVGFQTHPIRTCPTYRCERREGVYYDYKRIPSHTDRILWKSVEETPRSVEPLLYEPIPEFSTSDHKPVRGVFFLPDRPPLRLDPEKTVLNINLRRFKCKYLKPSASLLQGDVDTYLDFRCEPSLLELKSNDKERRGRTYTINSSHSPSWPREDVRFRIDVTSREEIHGAYLCIQCMNENAIMGDSLLGTVVIDLEHLIRRSLGVMEWTDQVERHLLRSGKDAGTLLCDVDIHWDKGNVSKHRRRSDARPSSSQGRAARSKSRAKKTSRSESRTKRTSRSKSRTKRTSRSKSREKNLSHYLRQLDMPQGLLSTVARNHRSCDKRYWFIDNSASMQKRDSYLIGDNFEPEKASRWEELSECVYFHSQMSGRCGLPTTFRLMNAPSSSAVKQQFSVSCGDRSEVTREMAEAKRTMTRTTPRGQSPLIQCITDFKKEINTSRLTSKGKHATLVVCTQGLPMDKTGSAKLADLRKFTHAVYSLSKLPVKIVIRLCTDDEKTTRSSNGLDNKLDNCECLDDWWGESLEVYLHNPWLCYGFGMHRLREAGLLWGIFDFLDERPLDLEEIHQFCDNFFVGDNNKDLGLPHPRDWKSFMDRLSELVKKEKPTWNAVKKKRTPWISLSKLESMFGPVKHRGKTWTTRESPRPSHQGNQHHNLPREPLSERTREKTPSKDMTLEDVLRCWSHQPPKYERLKPLHHLLVTIPTTFPPTNENVEPHEYFNKWKPISKEAFNESGDELNELLKRATRKMKLFVHPDKLPQDLTENQSHLFRAIWDVILESEAEALK